MRSQMDAAAIVALLQGTILPGLPAGARVRAVLEQPVPNSLNGKQSWWSSGFAYGVWQGVLCSFGIEIQVQISSAGFIF